MKAIDKLLLGGALVAMAFAPKTTILLAIILAFKVALAGFGIFFIGQAITSKKGSKVVDEAAKQAKRVKDIIANAVKK